MPMLKTPIEFVNEYWRSLIDADLLKFRLSEDDKPAMENVRALMYKCRRGMYFVFDKEEERIVAEFTLLNKLGMSMQVHFSMHPDNGMKKSIFLAKDVTYCVLNKWTLFDRPDEPYLHTLIGLTPAPHRRACLFIGKVGFKKQAVIPDASSFCGQICDLYVSIKRREGLDG